jgi:voltage-gated potassium channel
MEFTLEFVRVFAIGLFYTAPLLATLALLIVFLGHLVGRLEGWSNLDAMYHAFVAATTLGYGDLHPTRKRSKLLVILMTFVGIVFTGILVAIALHAAGHAFEQTHDVGALMDKVNE